MSKVSPQRAKSAQNALLAMFFFQGTMSTTQIPRVPELIKQISVDFNQWGLIMGFAAVGSILGLATSTKIIARFGAQRIAQIAILAAGLMLASFAFISNPAIFFLANVVWALAMSVYTIAVNSESVILQNAIKKVIIGRFHGIWAIGAMLSAAVAGILTTTVSIQVHFIAVAAIGTAAVIISSLFVLNKDESHQAERTKAPARISIWRTPRKVWLLAFGLFVSASPELALIDWSAIYNRDALAITDKGLASVPYTAFMVFMIVGRLSIGRLTKRWHISQIAAVGGLIAFTGLTLNVVLSPAISNLGMTAAVVLGSALWGLAGLGSSILVPSFFSASGHITGLDTATVMSRMMFAQTFMVIAAKILIGAVAQNADIRIAFVIPCALVLICAYVAHLFARDARKNDIVADAFPITIPIAVIGE